MTQSIRDSWRNLIGDFILEFTEAEVDVVGIFEDFASDSEIDKAIKLQFKERVLAAINLLEITVSDTDLRNSVVISLNRLVALAVNVRNLIAHNPLQLSLEGVISGSEEHEIRSFRHFDRAITLEELEQNFNLLKRTRDELHNSLTFVRHRQSWKRSQSSF